MSNKLFEYFTPQRGQLIYESSKDGRDHYMRGIFVQAEARNQNQRVYPLREISRAVEDVNDRIKNRQGSVLGELDHPEELTINLDKVSHIITEMWLEGNDGYGKLKLIDTPCGNIAKAILAAGGELGVSSRGSGNVGNDGGVSDFEIVTVDIVAQPSAPQAYPQSIYESLYNMRGGSQIMEVAKGVSCGDPIAKKHLQKDILKFINDLKL